MVARKKKAARVDPMQGALDLAAAGEENEDDPIDIGGDEDMSDALLDDEE
ncbi:MAG: hypothetical protein IJ092_10755 [Atopobiaceae bacterium]|nr:hypothetical protein [Atopobiaceae bacterium]